MMSSAGKIEDGGSNPPACGAASSRRSFLAKAGLAAASLLTPDMHGLPKPPPPRRARGFEVASSLYPWELHDEGIEHILDNLQGMAKVNSVYLIALMHYERRPFTSPSFPHNPVRKSWQAEDSRIYWHPDLKLYGRIKPQLSAFGWLNETDWVTVLTQAARKRRLKTGAEISHTVITLEQSQGELADCVQRDIHGASHVVFGRSYPLCPNNVDAQQYMLALFSDLAVNHDLDFLQTCLVPFMPGGVDVGGCFCPSCMKEAKAHGVDLERIKAVLLTNPQSPDELAEWERFRQTSLNRFFKVMHEGIGQVRPGTEFRWNDENPDPEKWGVDVRGLSREVDSIRVSDYSEQKGDPALMSAKPQWLNAERLAAGPDLPILSAVAVRPKSTPELVREGIRIAVSCGVNGISLGHYDGAEFPTLRAVGEGLGAAKVSVPATLA
jgi:hypothetical protein